MANVGKVSKLKLLLYRLVMFIEGLRDDGANEA